MNTHEIALLGRRMQEIRDQYEQAIRLIAAARQRALGLDPEVAELDGREVALEAHVRTYFIDPLLEALGWNLRTPENVIVEDAVEPEGADGNRRFLDYHGRSCDGGQSFLVVEAKRPGVALPDEDDVPGAVVSVIQLLVESGGDLNAASRRGLTQEWIARIRTLIDYARRVVAQTNHPPAAAVLTNGDWFVIFVDVAATLLSATPDIRKVIVLKTYADLQARCNEIYGWLSYAALSGRVPPQRPAALAEFISEGAEATCAHVVDVSYVKYGEEQPLISLRVAVYVLTPRNAWVLFSKEYREDFIALSSDEMDLHRKRQLLESRVADLIRDLRRYRNVRFLSATEVERIGHDSIAGHTFINSPLAARMVGTSSVRFRMTLGDVALYLTTVQEFDKCPFHFWAACSESGDAALNRAIMAPSSRPAAFFPNGSAYHCAHARVHTERRQKCLLLEFEEFLCCRRCAYFSRCWPDEGPTLPCTPGPQ